MREQRKLGFPAAVFAIFLVGTLMVAWARADRNSAVAVPPRLTDHWHAAYGIYVCDTWLPPLTDVAPDTTGIHTHDDGVVHVHPFSSSSAGERATWSRFGEVTGIEFDGTSFTTGGTTYRDGHDCNGEPATVAMYQWPADDPDAEPVIHTTDLGNVRFSADRLAFTLAVVPEGTEVPRPLSIPTLDQLSDVEPTGDTVPESPNGTAPAGAGSGEPSETDDEGVDGAATEPAAGEAPPGDDTAGGEPPAPDETTTTVP